MARALTTDLDASDGLYPFVEEVDEAGAPIEFLPMTEEEIVFEAENNGPDCGDDCEGIALWPGTPAWDGERLLVFYTKYTQRPGFLNVTAIGSSVAVWEDGAAAAIRPEVRPGEDEPTLLFEDVGLAAASVLEGDTLFAFVSLGDLHDLALCRVPVADVLDPDAWEFCDRRRNRGRHRHRHRHRHRFWPRFRHWWRDGFGRSWRR